MSPNLCVRLYADVANSYSRGVLRGIADFAKVHGGWDFDFDPRTEPIAASTLTRDQVNGDQVNGVLIYLRRHEDGEALVRSGIPAVNVANLLSPPVLVPSVFPDDHAVGAMAAVYFLERGFQSFAYCGSESREYSRGRHEGFGNALKPRTCACVNQDGDDPAHRADSQNLTAPAGDFLLQRRRCQANRSRSHSTRNRGARRGGRARRGQ